jgi:rhodanese-related sulfurtransferase
VQFAKPPGNDIGPRTQSFLQSDLRLLNMEIDVQTVKQMLDRGDNFILLDCREPDEVATAKIAGSLHIPMREIPARLAEIGPADTRVVVHCHHGGRSLRVTQFLRQQGYSQAQNMTGGIDAWSQAIDLGVPRY